MGPDDEIVIRLPLKDWQMIYAILEGAPYRDVISILLALGTQAQAQIAAHAKECEAQAAAAVKGETQPSDSPTLN